MEIPAVANHGLVDVGIVAKSAVDNHRIVDAVIVTKTPQYYFSHTNPASDAVTELAQYITMIDAERVVSQIG